MTVRTETRTRIIMTRDDEALKGFSKRKVKAANYGVRVNDAPYNGKVTFIGNIEEVKTYVDDLFERYSVDEVANINLIYLTD